MRLEILFSIYLIYFEEMHSSSKTPKNFKDSALLILSLFINNFYLVCKKEIFVRIRTFVR